VSNMRWGDTAGWFSAVATGLAAGFVLVQIWRYRREQAALGRPGMSRCGYGTFGRTRSAGVATNVAVGLDDELTNSDPFRT